MANVPFVAGRLDSTTVLGLGFFIGSLLGVAPLSIAPYGVAPISILDGCNDRALPCRPVLGLLPCGVFVLALELLLASLLAVALLLLLGLMVVEVLS